MRKKNPTGADSTAIVLTWMVIVGVALILVSIMCCATASLINTE